MDLAHYTAIARRPCTSDTQNSVLGKVEGASGNCSMLCVFVFLFVSLSGVEYHKSFEYKDLQTKKILKEFILYFKHFNL